MKNVKSLPSLWPVQMLFAGICLAMLFLLSTGCSSSSEDTKPVVIHDTVEVPKPVNLYGFGPLFSEGHEAFCQRTHCYGYPSQWYDCIDGDAHPYTNWEPLGYDLSEPSITAQGKPFNMEEALRKQGIPFINEAPSKPQYRKTGINDAKNVRDLPYGDGGSSAKTNSTNTDSRPFGWDIPSPDMDLIWWILLILLVWLLMALLRWLWRTFFSSHPHGEDRTDHILRHVHQLVQGQDALRGFMHRHFPEEQPVARPAAVADANATESVTAEDLISISVKGGGPNVLTEDISLTGTINVKRTFRDPNAPPAPAPSAPRGAE